MAIPISYNIRNLVVRKTTTIMAALGIALTVAVLLAMLSLVNGLKVALQSTGSPTRVLVVRKGATSELVSGMTRDSFQVIKFKPGIAQTAAKEPEASLEIVSVINLASVDAPDGSNVNLRGLMPVGIEMRGLKLTAGRWFTTGRREVVVGEAIAKRFPAARMGKTIRFGRGEWDVVGIMASPSHSATDSEIFADLNQVSEDFQRSDALSSVLIQATDDVAADALVKNLAADQRLNVLPMLESVYYDKQTTSALPIQFLGTFISIIMAVGSAFAATNTMYAAVARRSKEVGTLRVLGFSKGSILASFFIESVLLAGLGGVLGCLLVLPLNGLTTGIGNFTTFSETAFSLSVSPKIMLEGILFAMVLGALGDSSLLEARRRRKFWWHCARSERTGTGKMESELKSLRIDRSRKKTAEPSAWATRWIIIGVSIFVLLGVGRFAYSKLTVATDVDTVRVVSTQPGSAAAEGETVLNATGYIVAHHKIEVAAKVVGRVLWIGVEKGDKVKQNQVIVRLEDDEYRAQLLQAKGNLANLQAKLAELVNGSRPEEIEVSTANLKQAIADRENAKVTLERTRGLAKDGVISKQALDDAQARFDGADHHVRSLEKTDSLMRLGVRKEQIDAARGAVEQAKGVVDYAQTTLDNTIIKAPSDGTILERAVEKGEFVTTSFVGDKGAKGYVVSLADLNDLQAELDIAQNDFAKLHMGQKAVITTDAFPDRKYKGEITEFSPEANRQKATVQVKVKVDNPDSYTRPEMNANVAFLNDAKPVKSEVSSTPRIVVPQAAVKADRVFLVLGGKVVARTVKTGQVTSAGVLIEQGLIGGEDLIVSPPAGLKEGDRVHVKGA